MKFTDDEVNNLVAGIDKQNEELERLRAFAREVLHKGMDDIAILCIGVKHRLLIPRAGSDACDLAEFLKVPE